MRAAKVQASLRIRAVSPEPSLLAHTSSESRGTFRQKARSVAPLNGWACAVEICHDGMLEDTNSLGGAHLYCMSLLLKDLLLYCMSLLLKDLLLRIYLGLFLSILQPFSQRISSYTVCKGTHIQRNREREINVILFRCRLNKPLVCTIKWLLLCSTLGHANNLILTYKFCM